MILIIFCDNSDLEYKKEKRGVCCFFEVT